MSGILCDTCWFRKTTTGKETHLGWATDLREGDCVITEEQCGYEYEGHENLINCPILQAFYRGRKAKENAEPEPNGYEQLHLF